MNRWSFHNPNSISHYHPVVFRNIKAIVFDYGNVIARFNVQTFVQAIAPFTPLSLFQLGLALKRASGTIVQYETGLITSERFFSTMEEVCSLTITEDQFRTAYKDIFTPIDTTIMLIPRLKPAFKLGLLSNTSEWHFENEIRRNSVFPLFDAVSVSFLVKARKPAAQIYIHMLQQLRFDPRECIYIDDIKEFVEAAKQLGMAGIHYTSHDGLVSSLQNYGVMVGDG
jgi:putative hydrolase of the HAD superfamily